MLLLRLRSYLFEQILGEKSINYSTMLTINYCISIFWKKYIWEIDMKQEF